MNYERYIEDAKGDAHTLNTILVDIEYDIESMERALRDLEGFKDRIEELKKEHKR